MSPFPETRISLILRLAASEDAQAWREFACLYAPAVYALAQRRGLQAADAEDFVQELLLAVARAAGRWKPDAERARFRTWLHRVALNLLADHFRTSSRRNAHVDQAAEVELASIEASPAELVDEFEVEYRRAVFHRAAEIVQERIGETTWRAFELTAIQNVPAAAVSQQLGISTGNVYVARSRTMQQLKREIEKLTTDSEE